MNKKDIEDHKVVAAGMDWEQLTEIIIDLELEKMEFAEDLTIKDLKKYDKLLEIYENQKSLMVQELTTYLPWLYS